MSIKRRIEADDMAERLHYHGFKAIYGGSKGHGFWIDGKGWISMAKCRKLVEIPL